MKTPQPKSVLDQLRQQVQLDSQLAALGNELRALSELAAAMARVGARTSMVPERETPFDLETGSEDADLEGSDGAQRFEPFPLAKQAGVLQDAILGILPGAREDESDEGGQESEDAPVSIAQLAQGVASLERTVYSTGLLCQVTGDLLRALGKDGAEEANSLVVSFFHSARRLQEVIDVLGKVSAQNPQAVLPPSDYERLVQYLKEAQEKLDEFEGPDLPKQREYTTAFFAKRHNRSENTIRDHFTNWSKRKNNREKAREIGLWCITDWDVAVNFDNYVRRSRRTKASDIRTA